MVIPLDACARGEGGIHDRCTFDPSARIVTWVILDELVIQVVIPLARFVSTGG
jgi:hypothetical protein